MKLAVVLNASAGSLIGKAIDEARAVIEQGFAAAGNQVEIYTPDGKDLVDTLVTVARSGCDAVVIGGGDGSIATAADVCARENVPLGVLPLGTMNMLAKDLAIPLNLKDAIEALGRGQVRAIDVGEVNGETFLCNATLGLVPFVGAEREHQRGKPRLQMVAAMVRKVTQAAWRWPGIRVMLEHDGQTRPAVTRLLTVANNAYSESGGGFLSRPSLDKGILTVYLSRHRTRLGLMWFGVGLLLHFWQHDRRLETFSTQALTVRGRHRRTLVVSNDGEVRNLTLPLQFRIRPGALKVLAPSVPSVEEAAQTQRLP
jgi:diacylglycerol kinase family enzyme